MILGIGILLVVLWIVGFLLLKTIGLFIHVLLILAALALIWHFCHGGRRTA